MAAAAEVNGHHSGCDFEGWLSSKLSQIGLDENVFGSYVTGVLDAEDSNDEDRKDALIGILDGMTEHSVEELSTEILTQWRSSRADVLKKKQDAKEQELAEKKSKLAKVMEKQAASVSSNKSAKNVDADLKQQLLAKYSHESDDDAYGSDEEKEDTVKSYVAPKLTGNEADLFKNTNAQSVLEKEKEKRDKLKQDTDLKKQQIKDAKEKQKHKAEERKEKEKKRTQKGERRAR